MEKRFSRLAHFEEKRAYRRLLLTLTASLIILLSLIFLGIPALIKFSLLISSLKGSSETSTISDTTPPYPPRLEAPYTATNSAKIAVSGYGEPGTTLEVFLNGASLKKILFGNDGQFSLSDISLTEGENKITATAKDATGNISQPGNTLVIIYKKTPPALDITEPQDGQSFNGENKEAKITGITEAGAIVTINGRLVMVRHDGTFTYSLPLSSGENLIKIIASDIAGNQTIVERRVNYAP